MLDALPLGVLVLLPDGKVRFWNRALEQWTGVQRAAIVGEPFANFFESLRQPRYAGRLEHVFKRGAPLILSSQLHGQIVPCKLPGGAERIQHATVTGLANESGGYDALFAIQDVTDLTHRINSFRGMRDQALEAKAELEAQTKRLTETQHELEQFVHVASHDLQEPLRSLTAYSAFLEEDAGTDLPPAAALHLERIREAAVRMQKVIQDLLALSHATRTELAPAAVDLNDCLLAARDSLHKLLSETESEIRSAPLPTTMGVRSLLEQLLRNLLSNAVKFRRAGCKPLIEIGCERSGQEWVVSVSDNGIGIEPRHCERVFQPFFRMQSPELGGGGVSLAMCRSVVERHGGRIWIERRDPPGTVVRVALPVLPPGAAAASIENG